MTTRLRIVGYDVTPVLHTDDGETLSPRLQVNAAFVPAADWPNVQALVSPSVEQLRQQVEGAQPTTPIPTAPPNRATRRATQAKTNGKLDDVDA